MACELDEFLNNAEASLATIAGELGWTYDDIMKGPDLVACPFDGTHLVPSVSLDAHVERCRLLSTGVDRDEVDAIPPSSHFSYERVSSKYHVSVSINDSVLSDILTRCQQHGGLAAPRGGQQVKKALPLTNDRAVLELTRDERLAVYDYCVAEAKRQHQETSIPKEELVLFGQQGTADSQESAEKSRLEKLAELRDYKRRRQTYRAKNVHTTKKSYTEIIREVILNQMSMLAPHLSAATSEVSECSDSRVRIRDSQSVSSATRGDSPAGDRPSAHSELNVNSRQQSASGDPDGFRSLSADTQATGCARSPQSSRSHRSKRRSRHDSSRSRSRSQSRSKSRKKHKHKHKKARRSSQDRAADSTESH